jgi:hypothetical protein
MWKAGESGNPGGRLSDKAFLQRIKRTTKNGVELADLLLDIARNPMKPVGDRLQAIKIMLDRGFGKVPETINTNADVTYNLFQAIRDIVPRNVIDTKSINDVPRLKDASGA